MAILLACLLCDGLSGAPQLTPPLLVAALVSWSLCRWGVPRLRALKLGQVIREEGPQGHLGKAGTPTMGGLLAVPVGVIVGGLVAPGDDRLLAVAAITLAYLAIGGIDDWRSLTRQTNTGLTPGASCCCRPWPPPCSWPGPSGNSGCVPMSPWLWAGCCPWAC